MTRTHSQVIEVPIRARPFIVCVSVVLIPMMVLAVASGIVDIPFLDVIGIVAQDWGLDVAQEFSPAERAIVLDIRLPRVLLLLLVGGALSIAGVTLQATFQNSMAAPGILGISAGAALGAVSVLYLGASDAPRFLLPLAAFAGAMTTMLVVFLVSHLGSRPSTMSLLLTGVAVGSLCLACVTLVMLWTDEYRLKQVLVWTVGSAEGRTWNDLALALPPIVLGGALLLMRHRHLDALSLGEEHALSVGVPVGRERLFLLMLCALVAGAAVSVAGTIGFVGLIVPHIVRLIVGPRARALLPASFLVGGGFLVVCDLIARIASGVQKEYPVGIVTSMFGVPFFLWLLHRSKRSLT